MYVHHHLFQSELDLPVPRNAKLRKWIARIDDSTERLAEDLDWAAVNDESDDSWAQMYVVHELLSPDEQKRLVALLKELICRADRLLSRYPKDKGGNVADPFAWDLVFDLAFIYEWATGKLPGVTYNDYGDGSGFCDNEDGNVAIYESAFLDFVATVLDVFAPDRAKPNMALGKHVQRVLRVWRKARGLRTKPHAKL
jgi:hypothetical protein